METLIRKYNSQIVDREILMRDKNLKLPLVIKTSLKNEIDLLTNFVKDLEALIKKEYNFYVFINGKEFFEKGDLVLVTEEAKGTESIKKPYYAIINRFVGTSNLSISLGAKTWTVPKGWCKNKQLIVCLNEGVFAHSDSVGYDLKSECIVGWSFFDNWSNSQLKKVIGIYPKSLTGYPMICKSFVEEWCVRQFEKKELTDSELKEFIIKQQTSNF